MMKNCDICGMLNYHSSCVNCHIPNVCPACKDSSGRCKRCQPAPAARGCGRCFAADVALEGQCWSCQRLLCNKCIAHRSAQGVLCERCLPAAGKTSDQRRLLCPGCGKAISMSHSEVSFCGSCSRGVCNSCFPLTLRKGVVQCHCAASRNSNSEAATAAAIELAGEKCASAACSSKPAICPKLEHGRISDLSNANE